MTTEAEFWKLAAQKGLPRFRFLRRPPAIEDIDREFLGTRLEAEWAAALKSNMQTRDEIWPFRFHVRGFLGMRRGYVVLRNGTPIGGIVVEVS